jgi:hypothetical protein
MANEIRCISNLKVKTNVASETNLVHLRGGRSFSLINCLHLPMNFQVMISLLESNICFPTLYKKAFSIRSSKGEDMKDLTDLMIPNASLIEDQIHFHNSFTKSINHNCYFYS